MVDAAWFIDGKGGEIDGRDTELWDDKHAELLPATTVYSSASTGVSVGVRPGTSY